MAEENVPAPAPTRSDKQILPFNAWLPVGKGNLLLDLQKSMQRLGYTASNWTNSGLILMLVFFVRLWRLPPVDSDHPFESPPAGEQVMDFVNELGYPEEIHFVSKMHVNNLYQ
ncbi:hypothetical protein Tco_0690973 [Tanacetum coccineum]